MTTRTKTISLDLLKKLMSIQYNRLKEILKEQGRRQDWLADKIGMSTASISRFCSNKAQPSLEQIFAIAKILKVAPTDLIGSGEEEK